MRVLDIPQAIALLLHEVLDIVETLAMFLGQGFELLDEGVEPDRELERLVPQDLGAHGLPLGRVVPERLEEIVLVVDGRHVADYTLFPSQ